MKRILMSALAAVVLLAADSGYSLFEKGLAKERADADYRGAIKFYERVVREHARDRKLAAQALVRMGQCYDKLGDAESRKAYERVVREFGEQKEAVAEARKFLAAKGGPGETGVVARVVGKAEGAYGSAISRDGRYAVLRGAGPDGISQVLWLKDLVSGEARQLVSPKSIYDFFRPPLISPDGKQVAYTTIPLEGAWEVRVIGADGSNPRLLTAGRFVDALSWSPDGKHLLVISGTARPQKILLSVADGSHKVIGSGSMAGAGFSPDGSHFAFVKQRRDGNGSDIFLQSVNGGPEIPLVENAGSATRPTFTPDGKRLLFLSDRGGTRDLWSIPLVNGAPGGSPELVKQKARLLLGITSGGDCYYQTTSLTGDVYVAGVDVQNRKVTAQPRKITSRHVNFGPSWSPDGEYLAYSAWFGMPENPFPLKVLIRSVKTGEERELVPKEPFNLYCDRPQWFPDSRSLLLESWNDGKLRRVDVRTSEVRTLLEGPKPVSDGNFGRREPVILAPDGQRIYYLDPLTKEGVTRILRRDLVGGPETEVYRVTADSVDSLSVSADGGRLLFQVNSRGAAGEDGAGKPSYTIMTVAVSGGEPRAVYRTSPNRISHPVWSRDGRHVLFVRALGTAVHGGNEIYAIPAEGGEPRPFGLGPMHDIKSLAMHPDGKQIAFVDEEVNQQLWVLKNLFPAAKAAR